MNLNRLIGLMTLKNRNQEEIRDVRHFASMVLKPSSEKIAQAIQGISETEQFMMTETASWLPPGQLDQAGHFDTVDLRNWIEIAKMANVSHIPIEPILTLTEDEISVFSGEIQFPAHLIERFQKKMKNIKLPSLSEEENLRENRLKIAEKKISRDEVFEKIAMAMDNLPDGYMVRHSHVGSSILKALVGSGVGTKDAPGARFNKDFETGPGWLRIGNRRVIDILDTRFMKNGIVPSPGNEKVWLARPWYQPDRVLEDDDIHRRGSPLEGKGEWPAEWRVFIQNNKVIGVSSYYAWAGGVESIDAKMALLAVEKAQLMLDVLLEKQMIPTYMQAEFARRAPEGSPVKEMVDQEFPYQDICCSLDFLESKGDMIFLEGGPGYMPIGGGFPCAFAGMKKPEGVALRVMPGIDLMDPKTWKGVEPDGINIMTFEQALEFTNKNSMKIK